MGLDGLTEILVCLTNLKIEHPPLFADESIYNPHPEFEEEQSEKEATIGTTNSPEHQLLTRGRQSEGTSISTRVRRASERGPR